MTCLICKQVLQYHLHTHDVNDNSCVHLDGCEHYYHMGCLEKWYANHPYCPLCGSAGKEIIVGSDPCLVVTFKPSEENSNFKLLKWEIIEAICKIGYVWNSSHAEFPPISISGFTNKIVHYLVNNRPWIFHRGGTGYLVDKDYLTYNYIKLHISAETEKVQIRETCEGIHIITFN